MEHIIDCKGMKCPSPVINTKKYFDSIEKGKAVVIVDNEVAKNNIIKFSKGASLEASVEERDALYYITVNKSEVENSCEDIKMYKTNNDFVILITDNKLGNGDDKLGTMLMKSYLYALSESDKLPTDILFLNSGVKLVAEGSESIDSLKKLEERGVNIASCGICIDFYELKEKIQVGQITNMYAIVEKMNSAGNTIKL